MKFIQAAAAAAVVGVCAPASALTITLNNLNTVTPGTDAYNGFTTAARFWENIISNDVNVVLNVGYSALPTGVLGSTGSTTNVAYVGDVFNALANSKGGQLDKIAVANLNPKPSNFIGGAAIHEIGHALGFRSGVDTYDGNVNFGGNLGGFALMSVWDTFRFSATSTALGMIDWAIGGTGADSPYFSLDRGATVFGGDAYLSTGRTNGDGRQASHWKDNTPGQPQLGMMDPTVAFGQMTIVDNLDMAAFDAMGWNIRYDVLKGMNKQWLSARIVGMTSGSGLSVVPEPGTWALMIVGFGLVGGMTRRRNAATA